jgi:hypothetical protein
MLVQLLASYAPGHVISHGGRDYEFKRIDKQTKAALTVAYFKRAREVVYSVKDELTADEYDRQLKAVFDDYRRGRYNFPGMESFNYFIGAGIDELVMRLTACKEAEALSLLETRTVEVLQVCLCLAYESMSEEDKKKLQSQEGTAAGRALLEILSQTTSTNGSPSPKPTRPPASPEAASPLASSPATPTAPSN